MASFTWLEIASRLPVISADAIDPLSPGTTARMRLSIAFAHAVDRHGVAQPQRGRVRRVGGADMAEHEARGADALEIQIAREVVAAGPQRLERRRQPRLELDEAADRRRRALAHRHPHALERLVEPRAGDALDPHDDAVGALALLARLDEAGDLGVPDRRRQHRMIDDGALDGGGGKAGRRRGEPHDQRKSHRPLPNQDRDDAGGDEEGDRRPDGWFLVGGEIDDDPAAECDGEPGHQPTRPHFHQRPVPDALGDAACEIDEVVDPRRRGPAPGRAPRPPCLGASARSALLDHRAVPLPIRATLQSMLHEPGWPEYRRARCIHSLNLEYCLAGRRGGVEARW